MKISQLPKEVKEKALEYQEKERSKFFSKKTDYLGKAFDWGLAKEGAYYWHEWDEKEFKEKE
jgi:hypothetical protein